MRWNSLIYFDQEVNLKNATVRENLNVSNAISVANSTLTANTIDTVSNTQVLISTINTVSAADPNLGIRYDSLVIDSGQPDVSNLISQALTVYAMTHSGSGAGGNVATISVGNLSATALEAISLAADDFVVANVNAVQIQAAAVDVGQLKADAVTAATVVSNVLTLDPYVLVPVTGGFAMCHRNSNAPSQSETALQGYNVLSIFTDD